MVIKLNVRNDRNKRLWLIILTALTVAALLIMITMKIVLKDNSDLEYINQISGLKRERVFNAKKYNAKYNATIIGNKTTNKYEFEEEYEKDEEGKERFKIITKNETQDTITYEISENNLKINCNSQISEYILSDYLVRKTNILSISTFISLYNDIENLVKNSCKELNTKIEVETKEEKTMFRIIFNGYDEIFKSYSDLLNSNKKITKMELSVSNDDGKPLEYTIYDDLDKAFVDIEYSLFDIK